MRCASLALVLALAHVPPCGGAEGGYIGNDPAGNLIINATAGTRVLVDGVDVRAQALRLAALEESLAALASRLDEASRNSPFGKMYVVGGFSNPLYLKDVSRFDGRAWSLCKPLALAREFAQAAVFKGSAARTLWGAGTESPYITPSSALMESRGKP
jgi:hypothetical protein